MASIHKIGGARAKGFARLKPAQRARIATKGGQCCAAQRGASHMAAIGRKGAAVRYGKWHGKAM